MVEDESDERDDEDDDETGREMGEEEVRVRGRGVKEVEVVEE